MTETDIIALATFLVSYENLMVNKAILDSNNQYHLQSVESGKRQELLLEQIAALLKEKTDERTL